ncbi:MAG: peptidoglycan-associated lipoprotein Pal [Rhodocyclaceae bacterium]|nr:peptidoglycan-associated lipoprotein Pal [Rhodocyclaceae bacterium]
MKQNHLNLVLAGAVLLALGACASKKPAASDAAAIEDRGPAAPAAAPATEAPVARADSGAGSDAGASAVDDGSGDVAGAPSARQIFFDLDQFTIKPEYQGVVQDAAEFLKSKPKVRIVVQGHTDERGTSEYNLSLGQKRAEAVRRALGVLGVADDRIDAVSFGEEKPMAECHDESCWSKNRRADIVYQAR